MRKRKLDLMTCVCASCCRGNPAREALREARARYVRRDMNIRGTQPKTARSGKPFSRESKARMRGDDVHFGWQDLKAGFAILARLGLRVTDVRRRAGDVPGVNVVDVVDSATNEPRGTRTLVLDREAKRWRVEA